MGKEWQVCLEGAEVFCGVLWQGSHQKGPCWVRKADFYWGGRACLPFMNKIESQSLIVNSWGSIEPFDQQEKTSVTCLPCIIDMNKSYTNPMCEIWSKWIFTEYEAPSPYHLVFGMHKMKTMWSYPMTGSSPPRRWHLNRMRARSRLLRRERLCQIGSGETGMLEKTTMNKS